MSAMFFFKRIIVVFWALWWMLAFLTDFLGGLYLLNVFTEPWVPRSNYPALVASLTQYDAPNWLPGVFFVGIVAWSLLSALAFFISDQVVMMFDLEQNHMVQGGFQLLTFMAIHFLPDD